MDDCALFGLGFGCFGGGESRGRGHRGFTLAKIPVDGCVPCLLRDQITHHLVMRIASYLYGQLDG